MPRPRKPTELLHLSGAFDKNPNRRRAIGPKSQAMLGEPPETLSPGELAIWREFVASAPANVLTSFDAYNVEIVARLMAKFRADWLTGAEFGLLKNALTELGATPASRSKITAVVPDEAAANPWDSLQVIAGGKA